MIFNAAIPSDGSGGGKSTYYGTSSTAASTTTKVISGVTGWTPSAGDILTVYFSTANTVATPNLSINNTVYTIYVGGASVNATTNVLKWSAYTMLEFVFNGTQFQYITSRSRASYISPDGGGSWHGASSTAAATAAKVAYCTNYRLTPGARISVHFTTANTYSSGAITLNVNSTGAKTVYVHGAATSSTNTLLWEADTLLTFEYDGDYYRFVGSDAATPAAQTYTASWTATSTSANGVALTNSLTLPAGTYVVTLNAPVISANLYVELSPISNCYGAIAIGEGTMSWIVTLTSQTTITPKTAMSTACTYTYTERGRLTAVRVTGVGTGGERFERKTSGLGVTFTAESGFTISKAEEFSDGGLYHCKIYVTKTSAWTAWANVKIGSATGLRGAIVCNDALYGSVNSTSNNIWVVPRAAFSANQSVEAEVIGFLA